MWATCATSPPDHDMSPGVRQLRPDTQHRALETHGVIYLRVRESKSPENARNDVLPPVPVLVSLGSAIRSAGVRATIVGVAHEQ